MTAHKAGNLGVEVLSTAMLVGLIERAALGCLEGDLAEGEISVGTHVEIEHRRPVPVGFLVRIEVEVALIDGPRVSFAVRAFDESDAVAEGTHERFIIDRERFRAKLAEKLE